MFQPIRYDETVFFLCFPLELTNRQKFCTPHLNLKFIIKIYFQLKLLLWFLQKEIALLFSFSTDDLFRSSSTNRNSECFAILVNHICRGWKPTFTFTSNTFENETEKMHFQFSRIKNKHSLTSSSQQQYESSAFQRKEIFSFFLKKKLFWHVLFSFEYDTVNSINNS